MAVYYTNDAAFDLPDLPLIDRTVTTLDAVTADHRAGAPRSTIAPRATRTWITRSRRYG